MPFQTEILVYIKISTFSICLKSSLAMKKQPNKSANNKHLVIVRLHSTFLDPEKVISFYLFLNWFVFGRSLNSTLKLFHSFLFHRQKHFLSYTPLSFQRTTFGYLEVKDCFFALNMIHTVCGSTGFEFNFNNFNCKNYRFVCSLYSTL